VTTDILLFPDSEALGIRASSICIDCSKITGTAKGTFSVAVSGGTTPLKLFGRFSIEKD